MTKYEFLRFPEFKLKAITLSYDDGVIFDEKLISILDKHGLKCTFNLDSGLFGVEVHRRLTEKQVFMVKSIYLLLKLVAKMVCWT